MYVYYMRVCGDSSLDMIPIHTYIHKHVHSPQITQIRSTPAPISPPLTKSNQKTDPRGGLRRVVGLPDQGAAPHAPVSVRASCMYMYVCLNHVSLSVYLSFDCPTRPGPLARPHHITPHPPQPPNSFDFASLDNVVMSPHRGGAAGVAESETRRMRELARVVNAAVARGGTLQEALGNRVCVRKGY